jgi:hypothetical protein
VQNILIIFKRPVALAFSLSALLFSLKQLCTQFVLITNIYGLKVKIICTYFAPLGYHHNSVLRQNSHTLLLKKLKLHGLSPRTKYADSGDTSR